MFNCFTVLVVLCGMLHVPWSVFRYSQPSTIGIGLSRNLAQFKLTSQTKLQKLSKLKKNNSMFATQKHLHKKFAFFWNQLGSGAAVENDSLRSVHPVEKTDAVFYFCA